MRGRIISAAAPVVPSLELALVDAVVGVLLALATRLLADCLDLGFALAFFLQLQNALTHGPLVGLALGFVRVCHCGNWRYGVLLLAHCGLPLAGLLWFKRGHSVLCQPFALRGVSSKWSDLHEC